MRQPLINIFQQGDEVVTNQEVIFSTHIVPKDIKGVVVAIANEFLIVEFSSHYGMKCMHIKEVDKCV